MAIKTQNIKPNNPTELKEDCYFFWIDHPDMGASIECCKYFKTDADWKYQQFDCKDCSHYISMEKADKIITLLANTKTGYPITLEELREILEED